MRIIIVVAVATLSLSAFAEGGALALIPQSCQTPKDCKGNLPRHCMACPDGKGTKCSHWACIEQQCKIVTCEDVAPTPTPAH